MKLQHYHGGITTGRVSASKQKLFILVHFWLFANFQLPGHVYRSVDKTSNQSSCDPCRLFLFPL